MESRYSNNCLYMSVKQHHSQQPQSGNSPNAHQLINRKIKCGIAIQQSIRNVTYIPIVHKVEHNADTCFNMDEL